MNGSKRFRVALSFPGEKRPYVREVADILAQRFGQEAILYDHFHTAEFARPNLGLHLPDLYHKESELIVVVLSQEYENKDWCGLEWRAIFDLIKKRRDKDVMFFRADHAEIRGLYSLDGDAPIDAFKPKEAANLILQRLALNEGRQRDFYLLEKESHTAIRSRSAPKLAVLAIAIAIVALLLFLPFLSSKSSPPTFRLLLTDIDGPNEYGLTESLIESLRIHAAKSKDVLVISSREKISPQSGSDRALKLAAKHDADLVIWGWYRKTAEKTSVNLHFDLAKSYLHTVASTPGGIARIYPTAELENFVMQQRLSSEISILARYIISLAKIHNGKHGDALAILNEIIEPSNWTTMSIGYPQTLLARSRCYQALGSNHNLIISELTKAISLNTNLAQSHLARGMEFEAHEKWKEAIADYKTALNLAPGHGIPLIALASAFASVGELDAAIKSADEAVARDPSFIPYAVVRVSILAKARMTKRAIDECSSLLDRASDLAPLLLSIRGTMYSEEKDFDKAIRDLTKAINSDMARTNATSRGDWYSNRGNAYSGNNQHQKALEDYDESQRANPKNPLVYLNRSSTYLALGNPQGAVTNLTAALALNPGMCVAYYGRGDAYRLLNNFDAATADFSAAISCDTNFALAYEARGLLALQRGDWTNAFNDASKAIDIDPNLMKPYQIRGPLNLYMGMNSNAVSDFTKLIESKVNEPLLHLMRGIGYYNQNKAELAERDFQVMQTLTNKPKLVQLTKEILDGVSLRSERQTHNGNIVGLISTPNPSSDQSRTKYGTGLLVEGKKALYIVTSASIARHMGSNAIIRLRGESNQITSVSLGALADRGSLLEPFPLWFYHPRIDCAVAPIGLAQTFRVEVIPKIRFSSTAPLTDLDTTTNVLSANSLVVAVGYPVGGVDGDSLSLRSTQTTTLTDFISDADGTKHALLSKMDVDGFEGAPVFDRRIVQLDPRNAQTILFATLWGFIAFEESESQTNPARASLIHISNAGELIRDIDTKLNFTTNSVRAAQ